MLRFVSILLFTAIISFSSMVYGVMRMQKEAIQNGSAKHDEITGRFVWIKPTPQPTSDSANLAAPGTSDYDRQRKESIQRECRSKGFSADDYQNCVLVGR